MIVQLAPLAIQRFFDNNNNPLAGGQLYTYQAGTTTPQATYTDYTGVTANPNPVPLNARGEASVWLTSGQAYKFVLEDASGNTIWTQDQIGSALPGINVVVSNITALRSLPKIGIPTALVLGYSASGDGGGGIYWYNPSDTTSADNGGSIIVANDGGRWYLQVTGNSVSAEQFGAVGNLSSDDTTAFQNAMNSLGVAGGTVTFSGKHLISNNLTIPPNVTLQGPMSFVGVMTANSMNSNYAELSGSIALSSSETISVSAGACIYGALIYRSNMTFPATDSSQFAGTAVTMIGDEGAVKESMILGFNQAVTANGVSKLSFLGVRLDCNSGILVNNSGDVCHFERCHAWSYAVFRPGVSLAQLQRSGAAYTLSNSNDWTKFTDCFSYGFLTGFSLISAQSVVLEQCGADNTASGYGTGFSLTGTSADIELIGCQAAAQVQGFYFNNSGFAARMTGCVTWGCTTHGIMLDTSAGDVTIIGGEIRNVPNGLSIFNAASRVDAQGLRMDSSVTVPINLQVATSLLRLDESCNFSNFPAGTSLFNNVADATVPTIASASAISLPWTGDLFNVSGTTGIGTLFGGYAGREVTLLFQGSISIFNSTGAQNAMRLSGSATFNAVAGSSLTLAHNGVQWTEVGRCA